MVEAVLFDFDNTIANTESVREIRERGTYHELTPETMQKVKMYKPVPAVLEYLRKQGIKTGVVTNSGSGYIAAVFEHLGLKEAFGVVVTYTDVKADGMKPSPKGLQLAMTKLGVKASANVLYVGDENHDHVAAYNAGITPIMPSWATKKPVSMAPAMELSSTQLMDYVSNPAEYHLFAEQCAELKTADYKRKGVYFLPLDSSANVVTMKDEMTSFCLGRYFSQKAAVTAWLHDRHALSKEIQLKEEQDPFEIPKHWPQLFAHAVRHGAAFAFDDAELHFDVVTVVPGKQGKDPRLERLLGLIDAELRADKHRPEFVPDLFYYVADAQSQKYLHRNERSHEANRALQLNAKRAGVAAGRRVLIIDDVTTTGSTMARARDLALQAGASSAMGLALAKTVSIMADERPCPACARPMKVKQNGKTGDRFWGCSGYSDPMDPCRHTEPLMKKMCPSCGRDMRMHTNRHTKVKFWSCTGYNKTPACNRSMDVDPSEMPH